LKDFSILKLMVQSLVSHLDSVMTEFRQVKIMSTNHQSNFTHVTLENGNQLKVRLSEELSKLFTSSSSISGGNDKMRELFEWIKMNVFELKENVEKDIVQNRLKEACDKIIDYVNSEALDFWLDVEKSANSDQIKLVQSMKLMLDELSKHVEILVSSEFQIVLQLVNLAVSLPKTQKLHEDLFSAFEGMSVVEEVQREVLSYQIGFIRKKKSILVFWRTYYVDQPVQKAIFRIDKHTKIDYAKYLEILKGQISVILD